MNLHWVHIAALTVVIAGWIVFAGIFLFRKKPPRERATNREPVSSLGFALQGMAYAVVWMVERTPRFTSILPVHGFLELIPPALAASLSIVSVWLSLKAVQTLGKQWSLEARLVENHELVTNGPYSLVRHPIYTAMLGKLLATGLVISHWTGLAGGIAVYAIGTMIRVTSEEKLLRARFGSTYDDYARRVPAVIPRLFP